MNVEQLKYEKLWGGIDAYRNDSPGELSLGTFLRVVEPQQGETLWDLGCGTGRAGKRLSELGLNVTLYDFTTNSRDPDALDLPFVQHDLLKPLPGRADYAYCTDVLEHIPEEDALRVLANIVRAGRRAFLQISVVDDVLGKMIGEPLHLTVRPPEWWRAALEKLECRIIWEDSNDLAVAFYVTAYADAGEISKVTVLNISDEMMLENVRQNLAAGYKELAPHQPVDTKVMLLAGGPSLAQYEEEIRERRSTGTPLITVNGSYNWCLERGITPSMQIMVDAREFNRRFVEPPVPRCWYLIASQCHPSVAASLPHDQVIMWHSGPHLQECIEKFDAERGKGREWYPVFGGSTVVLRAIPLLLMLGFRRLSVYGWDSCLMDDKHHAYSQPENDRKVEIGVTVGGRTFRCHPWMAAQAGDFVRLMKHLAPLVELDVRGDGLIAHIIKTAAYAEET